MRNHTPIPDQHETERPRPMCLTCHYFDYAVEPVSVCTRTNVSHGWADVCLYWQEYQCPEKIAA